MNIYDSFNNFQELTMTPVDVSQIPENFTTVGKRMFVYWNSGPNITSFNVHAEIKAVNSTSFEDSTLGDDNYCSGSNLCQNNEGDCDFNNQCDYGLLCGNNNCPTESGHGSNTNCCYDYCGQWLNISAGTLTSPNYPNYYENMMTCSWMITSSIADNILRIDFDDFRVRVIQID